MGICPEFIPNLLLSPCSPSFVFPPVPPFSPLQAGFNSGDDVHYYNVPGSRTPTVQSLSHRSNLGVPGRWAFRVDHFEATEGPPETPGTLSKAPEAPWTSLAPYKPPSVSPNSPRTTEEQVYMCGL